MILFTNMIDTTSDRTLTEESFLLELKSRTSTAHRELEELPLSKALVSPDLKKDQYFKYLELMRDVIDDAENNIFPMVISEVPDLDLRRKLPLIQSDLQSAGLTSIPLIQPLTGKRKIDLPEAMGMLYVIEGSTLGGRFILKNILSVPGIDEPSATSYFKGYGSQTGSYWKSFLTIISAYAKKNGEEEKIFQGAVDAFELIHKHFASHP